MSPVALVSVSAHPSVAQRHAPSSMPVEGAPGSKARSKRISRHDARGERRARIKARWIAPTACVVAAAMVVSARGHRFSEQRRAEEARQKADMAAAADLAPVGFGGRAFTYVLSPSKYFALFACGDGLDEAVKGIFFMILYGSGSAKYIEFSDDESVI